jgi:hypothetical protein
MQAQSTSGHHDLRRTSRQPCDQRITVVWRDTGGQEKFVQAKAVDICELGLRFEMPEALARQTYLTLGADKLGLRGTASVRHCTRIRGFRFVVGVEFSAGLRWTPRD